MNKNLIVNLTHAKKVQIAEKLLQGISPSIISIEMKISTNSVLSVLSEPFFSAKCLILFTNQARGLALVALHNISRIAFDTSASPATQLKASVALVNIAQGLNDLHRDDLEPSQMTQNQLSERLTILQKEAVNRAKPIDVGIIDIDILN